MLFRRLAAILALALLVPDVSADTIRLSNGREINGKITKETYSQIEYRRAGVSSKQTVDVAEVVSVEYSKTSKDWREAQDLLAAGNMGAAAGSFLNVADDEDLDAFLRAAALANAGDALVVNGNYGDALGFYDELLQKYPSTRHLARALLGKGTCLFYTRKLADADKVLEQLKTDATGKKLGDRWAMEAEFLLLWSAEAQGKPGVVDGYKALRAKARGSYPGISNKAALRMGRVQLEGQNVRDAEALFDEILESRLDTDSEVVAGAYNGRGRCNFGRGQGLMSQGRAEEALPYFHDALLDFLRVHVSYPGVFKEQAESLYFAGQSFLNVAALDPEASDAEMRGQVLLKRCRDGYAGSEWASLAASQR
jgi:tetratricopeptide (TPR) repeat protein